MNQTLLTPNFTDPDGFYEALMDAHAGLTPEESSAYNARLILLLANQIGDSQRLLRCVQLAYSNADTLV